MRHIGTVHGGMISSSGFKSPAGTPLRVTDAAIASGSAYLVSELERRDELIREPLTSFTYARDIPIRVGGGWIDTISALNIDYGVSGGSTNGPVTASGSNGVPIIQANLGKGTFRTHVFTTIMRIMYIDMQRSAITGRSLDQMLTDGIRLEYDKHMDANTYIGLSGYNTTGLLNNPDVTAMAVPAGTSGQTVWSAKTPDEILSDINNAITECWAAAEYDLRALPNHIIMPFTQYNYIATQKVSPIAEKTILTFILENNICNQNGGDLILGATQYCKGAGTGATDRMMVYVHNDRFIAMDELVPLARTMTQPNIDALAYDSVYSANISEVEIFYTQTILYVDGI